MVEPLVFGDERVRMLKARYGEGRGWIETRWSGECFCLFNPRKELVDPATGKRGYGLASLDVLADRVFTPETPYFLGVRVGAVSGVVCIDVDAKGLGLGEATDLALRVMDAFRITSAYAERSLSGGIHLFVRRPEWIGDYPSVLRGEVFGYPVEIYTDAQHILLTLETLPLPPQRLALLGGAPEWDPRLADEALGLHPLDRISKELPKEPAKEDAPLPARSQKTGRQRKTLIYSELLHWFPSVWKRLLPEDVPIVSHPKPDQLRLRRPGKKKGHSATLFLTQGVLHNFSTNWTGLPRGGYTLRDALARMNDTEVRAVIRAMHQYLCAYNPPRRKYRNYHTLRRREALAFLTALLLVEDGKATYKDIQDLCVQHLGYTPARQTARRAAEKLLAIGWANPTRTQKTTLQPTPQLLHWFETKQREKKEIGVLFIEFIKETRKLAAIQPFFQQFKQQLRVAKQTTNAKNETDAIQIQIQRRRKKQFKTKKQNQQLDENRGHACPTPPCLQFNPHLATSLSPRLYLGVGYGPLFPDFPAMPIKGPP